MTPAAAILGKGGVGKTFVATHLAMACGYLGVKTLLVGCDQKQDTHRALSHAHRPSLMETLDAARYDLGAVDVPALLLPVSPHVDVLELGPGPLLTGTYDAVYEQFIRVIEPSGLLDGYAQVIFDANDERLDAVPLPLLRRVRSAVLVTDESPQALWVLNRMLRALLIGGYELDLPVRVLGVVNNRSQAPLAFERYVERTRCLPLLNIPEAAELARLRADGRTLFAAPDLPRQLDQLVTGFIRLAERLQSPPLALLPLQPLPDEEVWTLGREEARHN
jgi:nitrogenase subunit NifH